MSKKSRGQPMPNYQKMTVREFERSHGPMPSVPILYCYENGFGKMISCPTVYDAVKKAADLQAKNSGVMFVAHSVRDEDGGMMLDFDDLQMISYRMQQGEITPSNFPAKLNEIMSL